jgi:UDP-N-acetylmuramoyl-tripeptide--D-alanyl-D-alanine ligase
LPDHELHVEFSRLREEERELPDGGLLLNDCYNANPVSMRAALEHLTARASGRRRVAVLGEMAELGDEAAAAHEQLGRLAVRLGVTHVIAVGGAARPIHDGAVLEGSGAGESSWVPDADAAIDLLRSELRPQDVVLVKASRAARLERVALAIADDAVQPEADGGRGG